MNRRAKIHVLLTSPSYFGTIFDSYIVAPRYCISNNELLTVDFLYFRQFPLSAGALRLIVASFAKNEGAGGMLPNPGTEYGKAAPERHNPQLKLERIGPYAI